jgi:N-ethylmaleimide reductase
MASMSDSTPAETFSYLAGQLGRLGIGYLHVTESRTGVFAPPEGAVRITPILREKFSGALMVNGSYDLRTGNEAVERGEAQLVSYGMPFLANPDLPERFRTGGPLNTPDSATFYTGEEKGYIDYPALGTRA